jgi:hypothetical protein
MLWVIVAGVGIEIALGVHCGVEVFTKISERRHSSKDEDTHGVAVRACAVLPSKTKRQYTYGSSPI